MNSVIAPDRPVPVRPGAAADARWRSAVRRGVRIRQAAVVIGMLALIGVVDQVSKAWAWRHVPDAHINSGADMLVSPVVGSWYRDPVLGAALDVAGVLVLLVLGGLLVRRRRRWPVLLGASIALAGWASNLADRLGLHRITAPGSVRGAVDFLQWQGRIWNLADLAIGVGSALLLTSALAAGVRSAVGGSRRPEDRTGANY
jgi:lipoprotein signal peptidase